MTLLGIKPGYVPAARGAAWAWLCAEDAEEWLRAGPGAGRVKRGRAAAEHVRAAELVGVAAASLPPYRVRAEDVPTRAGDCVTADRIRLTTFLHRWNRNS